MTNKEAKQAKIREAWGKVWEMLPPYLQQEALGDPYGSIPFFLSENVDDEAFCRDVFSEFDLSEEDFCDFFPGDPSSHRVRPRSIIGIDGNNGWKRIAGPEDLPKEKGEYHFLFPNIGTFRAIMYNSPTNYFIRGASHWREPEVIPKPLY